MSQPWEIGRMISCYVLNSQGAKLERWEDVFAMDIDFVRGKRSKKEKALANPMTEEEKRDYEMLTGKKSNG